MNTRLKLNEIISNYIDNKYYHEYHRSYPSYRIYTRSTNKRKRTYSEMIHNNAFSLDLIHLILQFVFGTNDIRCVMNCFRKRNECKHDKYRDCLNKLKLSLKEKDDDMLQI